jgi:hypothetical protein
MIKTSLFFTFCIDKPLQIDTAKASMERPTPIKKISINKLIPNSFLLKIKETHA